MKKTFHDLLSSGEKFFGTMIQFPSPEVVEIVGAAGCCYVIIDNEHCYATHSQTLEMLRAAENAGIPAMIRVPNVNELDIKRALDMGFTALRFPSVSSAEEAAAAVRYAMFPPVGERGLCPNVRANRYSAGNQRDFCERSNKEIVIAMNIEGKDGIDNMEEIIKQEGVDIINVGRADLAASLGLPGEMQHPRVEKAVKDVANLALKYGKCSGTYIAKPEDASKYADCPGITHFLVDSPETMLLRSYREFFSGIVNVLDGHVR